MSHAEKVSLQGKQNLQKQDSNTPGATETRLLAPAGLRSSPSPCETQQNILPLGEIPVPI